MGIEEHRVSSKGEWILWSINEFFIFDLILFKKSHKIQGNLFLILSDWQLPYHKEIVISDQGLNSIQYPPKSSYLDA